MWSAAKIDEVGAQRVFAKSLTGSFGDQLALHPRFGILLKPFFFTGHYPFVRKITLLNFPHLGLDLLKVFRCELFFAIKIVIKTVFDRRADT